MQYELQIFTGRDYAPTGQRGELRAMQDAFAALPKGAPRRLVAVDKARELRPKYRKPPRAAINAGRSVDAVIQDYLAWAQRAGIPALTFYDDARGRSYARTCGKQYRLVDPAEFLGPAPAAEIDTDNLEDVAA